MYLYRTDKAERFEDLIDLENQLTKRAGTRVDLYKIAGDLAVVFLNNTEPYDDTDSIVYRMLFGRPVRTGVDFAEIGGFLPSSMIPEITTWIKEKGINSYDGFSKIYDNLSDEVKQSFHEVPISKAAYSQSITSFADGTVTTEIKNYKTNEIIRTETYRGEEPFGVWKFKQKDKKIELNYDFELIYSDKKCLDTIVGVSNYFENNTSLRYIAPVDSTGGFTIYSLVYNKIRYPAKARENGISGQVIISFTITREGNVGDIVVLRGTNILLDKEAVRVIRELRFSSPAMLDDKPVKICVKLPVKYVLD